MKSLWFALSITLCAGSALAQGYAYEQPMAPSGGNLRASQLWIDPTGQNDLDSDAIAWEDFEFPQDATIARVRWWGETAPSLGFRISFYHQDPGTIAVQPDIFAPGSTPISQFVTTSFTQTAVGAGLYRFDLDLPTPLTFLAHTRYFLSVVGRTPIAYANWNWAASSSGPNGTFWWLRGAHMYFHLGESRAMGLAAATGWPAGDAYCFGDGTGTACPCANASALGAGEGCLNSLGTGGRLRGWGVSSIASDQFVLTGTGMPNSACLYFQGTTQTGAPAGSGATFGDGLRCAGGAIIRLGTKTNTAGASQYPVAGDASISVRGGIVAGNTRTYQGWYRNAAAFCAVETFNCTNGLSTTWTP